MDEDQLYAYNLILQGHNLCLTGQAGTGKSFVVKKKKPVKALRKGGVHVALTCSTGIGATVFEDEKACTLHKWAGLADGIYENDELLYLIMNDEKYTDVKSKIKRTDYLFIDEVSMISSKILNQVEYVCRNVRGGSAYFGGLTIILSGDFWQLPPIRNELYGDFGHHCFTLKWFNTVFSHRINLNIIHRQSDTLLITAVNELERGIPSPATIAFIKSLSRPLSQDMQEKSVHLFARNIDVDLFNYNKVQGLEGQLHVFPADDEGDAHYINKFLAPKHLGIKIGCPVMLLVNLSDQLVNEKIGNVVNIIVEADLISVRFVIGSQSKTVQISKFVFSKYDPIEKCILAERVQYPLKLAYAVTIHKSQGMTLNSVTLDCKNATNPGQLGVALGRVKTTEGLLVKNFIPSLCKPHPNVVQFYYDSCSLGIVDVNKKCCKIALDGDDDTKNSDSGSLQHSDDDDHDSDDDDEDDDDNYKNKNINLDSDMSDVEQDVLKLIDEMEIPEDIHSVLNNCVTEFYDTPLSISAVNFKTETSKHLNKFSNWYETQIDQIITLGHRSFPVEKEKFAAKDFHQFYSDIQSYTSSKQYRDKTTQLCTIYQTVTKEQSFQFLTSMVFQIQRQLLKEIDSRREKETVSILKKVPLTEKLCGPARGKIRYISGYVVAKLKYRNSRLLRNSLFAKGKEEYNKHIQCKAELLDSVSLSYDEISHATDDPESLQETQRKQNLSEGLCNVNDDTYNFFAELEKQCRQLLTHENLLDKKSQFYMHVKDTIATNDENKKSLINLFSASMKEKHDLPENESIQKFLYYSMHALLCSQIYI